MQLASHPSASGPAGVRLLNPLEVADWDAQLAHLPGAGFFHTASWAEVLFRTYRYRPQYQAEFESGRLRSLLPLMEVDSWLTGRRGISLPFTDSVEPLCPDASSFQQLWSGALAIAEARSWKYLECRGGKNWFPEAPASTTFLSHSLALAAGETSLLAGFDDAVRRALRKAERSGLAIEISQSLDSLRTFYQLLCRTRRRHGVPPQPFPFFANIHNHVLAGNHGLVVLARQGATPVAGAVYFHHGRSAIYKFGASDETFQHLRANNLVMWRAIQHYSKAGYAALDFGRTSVGNEGLRKFKLGWGASETQTEYVRYDRSSASYVTSRDESSGWHNRVFRMMPLRLSQLAGALLYRHIA